MNIKFYYNNDEYFVSVVLPFGYRPTVFMAMGQDNRPFHVIQSDIECAIALLADTIPHGYTFEVQLEYELPTLLGYHKATPDLRRVGILTHTKKVR